MDRTVGGGVLGVGLRVERQLNDRAEVSEEEVKKVGNRVESRHPGMLLAVQMTPLTFSLSLQKDVPASGSVHHVDSNS